MELTSAVNHMGSGRAPGINGLSVDFLKTFWNTIGHDLHGVFLECYRTGSLPVSSQRAVLSLLHKKGELALCVRLTLTGQWLAVSGTTIYQCGG